MDQSLAASELKKIVGDAYVKTDPADLQAWGTDWTRVYSPDPLLIVFPASTAEVSAVVKWCHKNRYPVVPSGGRTGLVAGAVAAAKEIVLSLDRMNKIENIDPVGMTISAQAGVVTERLQDAARQAGLFFPIDLAAKGSCQIGGNIATNAGGVKLIRYGGMREQVLGLEVILANGDILNLNSALLKNNSGYDLRQLFIGSEGTLGIVTRCTLKLAQKPKNLHLSVMAVQSFAKITEVLKTCHQLGVTLTAFEFFTLTAHQIVLQHQKHLRSPFAEKFPFYILLEIEDQSPDAEQTLQPLLEKLFSQELIEDAVIAANSQQFQDLWGLRENITESLSAHGQVRKNDISLAIRNLDAFLGSLEKYLSSLPSIDMQIVLFGHIGDGNLHINYVAPKAMDKKSFHERARAIELEVFKILQSHNGSISAEHGIGLTKKADLHFTRTAAEVDYMRKIKSIFDPEQILNPGKIFDIR